MECGDNSNSRDFASTHNILCVDGKFGKFRFFDGTSRMYPYDKNHSTKGPLVDSTILVEFGGIWRNLEESDFVGERLVEDYTPLESGGIHGIGLCRRTPGRGLHSVGIWWNSWNRTL